MPRAFPRTLQDSDFCQHWCPNADKWKWTSVFDTFSFLRTLLDVPLGRNLRCQKIKRFCEKEIILWKESKKVKKCTVLKISLHCETNYTVKKSTLVKTLHCENYHTAKILHCYKYCNVKILGCQDITLWKLLQCKNLTPSSYHSVKILHCCNRDDTVRTEIMLCKDMPQTRQHVLKARWRIFQIS